MRKHDYRYFVKHRYYCSQKCLFYSNKCMYIYTSTTDGLWTNVRTLWPWWSFLVWRNEEEENRQFFCTFKVYIIVRLWTLHSPDCISNIAASSANSVLSSWSLASPTANSNMGSTSIPSPSDLIWDLWSRMPLCMVMVSAWLSYRHAARRHIISMQQDFRSRIWSSTNNWNGKWKFLFNLVIICSFL